MAEEVTTKEKKPKKGRVGMPEQDPKVRARNFDEVPPGYTPEMAKEEAARCLQCKKPGCVDGCPVGIDIPGFIRFIKDGDFTAVHPECVDAEQPAGRLRPGLPAGDPVRGPVHPGQEGRAGGDRQPGAVRRRLRAGPRHGRPAPQGGPDRQEGRRGRLRAGRADRGRRPDPAWATRSRSSRPSTSRAGCWSTASPSSACPRRSSPQEVNFLERLGVKVECNVVVGRTVTVDELFQEGYDAVFVGLGAGLPKFMNIPGENLIGVLSANEYLTRANLMKAYLFPKVDTPIPRGKDVVVLGGGNVAMDSARTALRLGADRVHLVYRRSGTRCRRGRTRSHHAEEEGIEFFLLTTPVRYLGDEKGRLVGMECLKMELGEPDASGRRRPVPVKGSEFKLDCDLCIVAIGTGANPLLTRLHPRPQGQPLGLHRGGPQDRQDDEEGRLGRRRHRHRRGHRDPGHGRRAQRRQLDPRLPGARLVIRRISPRPAVPGGAGPSGPVPPSPPDAPLHPQTRPLRPH